MKTMKPFAATLAVALATAACGDAGDDAEPSVEDRATTDVKVYIAQNLADLTAASEKLAAAAPEPDADGWNASDDAKAVAEMKKQWKLARVAYEHVEGAIAVLFPELDVATDERYDGFLADIGADANLFDDEIVTGVHAIERILWADSIAPAVVKFESTLSGYEPAAFPSTKREASDFKGKLLKRLITDVKLIEEQFEPLALDPATAYRGVIGSLEEQIEKCEKAATGEEESRYAEYTLADMRANVEAGKATFKAFEPWLIAEDEADLVEGIEAGFDRVQAAYDALPGDELPPVPESWSSREPSAADLKTDFGKLWQLLHEQADPGTPGTLVWLMRRSAKALGLPELPE